MGQRDTLAAMDARMHAAFKRAGIADGAEYAPPGADPDDPLLSCNVFVDRDVQILGETRAFKAGRVEVVFVLSSLAVAPKKNGKTVVDGDTYFNDEELSNDGSLSRWLVRRG